MLNTYVLMGPYRIELFANHPTIKGRCFTDIREEMNPFIQIKNPCFSISKGRCLTKMFAVLQTTPR